MEHDSFDDSCAREDPRDVDADADADADDTNMQIFTSLGKRKAFERVSIPQSCARGKRDEEDAQSRSSALFFFVSHYCASKKSSSIIVSSKGRIV